MRWALNLPLNLYSVGSLISMCRGVAIVSLLGFSAPLTRVASSLRRNGFLMIGMLVGNFIGIYGMFKIDKIKRACARVVAMCRSIWRCLKRAGEGYVNDVLGLMLVGWETMSSQKSEEELKVELNVQSRQV